MKVLVLTTVAVIFSFNYVQSAKYTWSSFSKVRNADATLDISQIIRELKRGFRYHTQKNINETCTSQMQFHESKWEEVTKTKRVQAKVNMMDIMRDLKRGIMYQIHSSLLDCGINCSSSVLSQIHSMLISKIENRISADFDKISVSIGKTLGEINETQQKSTKDNEEQNKIIEEQRKINEEQSKIIAEQNKTIEEQRNEIEDLKNGRGAVYVRWGKKNCPSTGTNLVYTGIAGGGYYAHSGAAVNAVCLPHDPDLIKEKDTQTTGTARIYGAEYEDTYFGDNVYEYDVPCAVCITKHSWSILMIPARNHCYDGWKEEYNGTLAAGGTTQLTASEYICIDKSPDIFEGTIVNKNGKLLYPVKATCGALPCPPYTNNYVLTCVVCSK